jgi:hypothetical protein
MKHPVAESDKNVENNEDPKRWWQWIWPLSYSWNWRRQLRIDTPLFIVLAIIIWYYIVYR